MDEAQWVKSLLFSNYVQGLHNLGLLRAVAIYICNEHKISYSEFYEKLIGWSEGNKSKVLNRIYTRIKKLCEGIITGENEMFATFEKTGGILWGFDELIYLESFSVLEEFYGDVKAFVSETFEKSEVIDALFDYQRDIIKKIHHGEVALKSDYDFYSYFNNIYSGSYAPVEKKQISLKINDTLVVESFTDYAREVVWYGRNRRATDYTSSYYQLIN